MRKEKVIDCKQLVQSAESFLAKTKPGPGECSWRLVRKPKNLTVPATKNIQLTPRLGGNSARGYLTVEIEATSGESKLGLSKLLFKSVYPLRQVVATKDIAAGETFTQQNTKIRTIEVDSKPPGDWSPPYGMVAARGVSAGVVIRPGLFRTKKLPIIVRRNQAVTMKIEGPGFTLVAIGKALKDARPGDVIRVQNVDTNRVVSAEVGSDGTVEPIYDRR